jgi:hypothetical protein
MLEGLLDVSAAAADDGAGQDGFLPTVLQIDLGGREVELTMQPGQYRLDPAAFLLEGGTTGICR